MDEYVLRFYRGGEQVRSEKFTARTELLAEATLDVVAERTPAGETVVLLHAPPERRIGYKTGGGRR